MSVPGVNVPDKKKASKKEDVLKIATQVEEEGDSDSDGLGGELDEPVKVTKDRKSRYGRLSGARL